MNAARRLGGAARILKYTCGFRWHFCQILRAQICQWQILRSSLNCSGSCHAQPTDCGRRNIWFNPLSDSLARNVTICRAASQLETTSEICWNWLSLSLSPLLLSNFFVFVFLPSLLPQGSRTAVRCFFVA